MVMLGEPHNLGGVELAKLKRFVGCNAPKGGSSRADQVLRHCGFGSLSVLCVTIILTLNGHIGFEQDLIPRSTDHG